MPSQLPECRRTVRLTLAYLTFLPPPVCTSFRERERERERERKRGTPLYTLIPLPNPRPLRLRAQFSLLFICLWSSLSFFLNIFFFSHSRHLGCNFTIFDVRCLTTLRTLAPATCAPADWWCTIARAVNTYIAIYLVYLTARAFVSFSSFFFFFFFARWLWQDWVLFSFSFLSWFKYSM